MPAPEDWTRFQHLLVMAVGIGDLRTLQPAFNRLSQMLPDARLLLWTPQELPQGALRRAGLAADHVLSGPYSWHTDPEPLIERIRKEAVDAALIFNEPGHSPFTAAYVCYLAGIPVRVGQSVEFGGRVLSHRVIPAFPTPLAADHHLHLLEQAGLERTGSGPLTPGREPTEMMSDPPTRHPRKRSEGTMLNE